MENKKICANCECSTRDCKSGKLYCCNISWLRMETLGLRLVDAKNTCKACRVKQTNMGRMR